MGKRVTIMLDEVNLKKLRILHAGTNQFTKNQTR